MVGSQIHVHVKPTLLNRELAYDWHTLSKGSLGGHLVILPNNLSAHVLSCGRYWGSWINRYASRQVSSFLARAISGYGQYASMCMPTSKGLNLTHEIRYSPC